MCKDHLRSKAQVKNKGNTMLLMLSSGKISQKAKEKQNSKKLKWEY